MRRVLQRLILLVVFAATFAGVGLQARASLAQAGNWAYRPDLGGYLDQNTNLVWGDHNMNVMSPNFFPGWDYVNNIYLPNYRVLTNIVAWRMPTVAEAQLAAAHGINPVINNRWPLIPCWTSETAKIKGVQRAAAIYLENGAVEMRSITVGAGFVPVYSTLPPPPEPPPSPGKGKGNK